MAGLDLGRIVAQISPELTPEAWDGVVEAAVDRILANPAAVRRLARAIAAENRRARSARGPR
jgi:hypothetical protein